MEKKERKEEEDSRRYAISIESGKNA